MAAQGGEVPWSEKYRPRTLDEVAAHGDIIDTIKKLLAENNLPHLLFYGPPGTGKTSTILAIARQIYGPAMASMTLELNASDDRGIAVVRNEIQDFASTRTIFSNKFKLIILDECDAMTRDAQAALRRVMEKYTRNARFCLICNYVSKIIPALQSRCTRFRFQPLPERFVQGRLEHICGQESIKVTAGGLEALIELGGGDMRRTLNLLQSTCMSSGEVTEEAAYATAGKPMPADIESCAQWLLNEPLCEAFRRLLDLQLQRGVALVDVLQQLHPFVFRIGMPPAVRVQLVRAMADIEHRLAYGTSDRLQLGALCGAFAEAKEGIVKAAQSAADAAGAAASDQGLVAPPAPRATPQLDEAKFEAMLQQLREWKEKHWGDTIVPRKVHDAAELGEWVHAMRQARRRGRLPPHAVAALVELGFTWEVDVVTAKWYHNLHAARHYKEVHGGELPPAEGCDAGNPDWIEAGRWLERQRDLYRRQKLLLLRVRLMKELLGVKLEREHSRPRRNMHPVLKQGNAQFRALQRQRAQQGQAGATEQGAAQQGGEQQRRRVGRQQGRGQAAAEGSN
ncbi:hypothetical protein COHA_000126 [Chlorella ohadii]|uniref:AAA+ ATPase domain-containing protein n=1 Tax=Chlorella ohadii TaxID=2649997 RepID=A0AAD5E0A6_9CHLO|nr:hypothetical protein COHA_000126 [Chlorella ohadii]